MLAQRPSGRRPTGQPEGRITRLASVRPTGQPEGRITPLASVPFGRVRRDESGIGGVVTPLFLQPCWSDHDAAGAGVAVGATVTSV
jgi:hypothetical protein